MDESGGTSKAVGGSRATVSVSVPDLRNTTATPDRMRWTVYGSGQPSTRPVGRQARSRTSVSARGVRERHTRTIRQLPASALKQAVDLDLSRAMASFLRFMPLSRG